MTSVLRNVLTERAEGALIPVPDLRAIVRSGERRLGRRRAASTLGVAALTVAVVASGIVALRDAAGAEPPAASAAPAFTERRATWASGDIIHYGTDVLTVRPAPIAAFVQTDSAFVYVSAGGEVYAADRTTTRPIGAGNVSLRLTAGPTGSLVGWVDQRPRIPEFVVYDVASGKETVRTGTGNTAGLRSGQDYDSGADRPPAVAGIDGGQAYFEAADGLYRWDLAAGTGRRIRAANGPNHLTQVAGGTLVSTRYVTGSSVINQVASTDPAAAGPAFQGLAAYPSPRGRYLFVRGFAQAQLYDFHTGRQVSFRYPGYQLVQHVQWLDDDRFSAVGFRPGAGPLDLLTCSVRAGGCTLTVRGFAPALHDDTRPGIQLPFGRTIADAG